ncbi:MAG: MFS transporter [Geminicoccales bacterium]
MLRVLIVAGSLLVVAQLYRLGGGVISSELHRTFGLGPGEIGVVMGAMFLASALVQLPMGIAFDRFGTRRTVSASALVGLAGMLLFAVADGAAGLALGRALIGAGFAGVVTAILLLTMRWAPPERYSSIAATVLAGASAVAGLLATTPLALALQRIGWTPTFIAITLATAGITLLFHLLVQDAPSGADPRWRGQESLADGLRGLRGVLADRELRRVLAMGFCTIAPFSCVGGLWAGPYLQAVHGLDPAEASYVILGMVTTFNLGTLAYGPFDRWLGSRRRVVLGGSFATTALIALLALWPRPGLGPVLVLLHLFALAAPFYVTLTAHSRSFVPLERAGRLITTLNLCALLGAFVAQWLTGLLVGLAGGGQGLGTDLGYRLAFGFVALMLLAALSVYRLAPEKPHESARALPAAD